MANIWVGVAPAPSAILLYCVYTRTNFVDSAISSNNWFYRRTIGEQRSEMMSLNASQSYLLIGHVKEGGGGDHFHVSCFGTWRAGISPPKCSKVYPGGEIFLNCYYHKTFIDEILSTTRIFSNTKHWPALIWVT